MNADWFLSLVVLGHSQPPVVNDVLNQINTLIIDATIIIVINLILFTHTLF